MIFAKLDVCFWRHRRFEKAGPAAAGYWAAVLAYLREDDTPDGILPFEVVGTPLHVGARDGRRLCEKLVEVGLFERRETGYELRGYAEKNETRQQIDARRASTRSRVAKFREKQSPAESSTWASGNAVSNPSVTPPCNASVPGSGSGSGSVGSDPEIIRAREEQQSGRSRDDGTFGTATHFWAEGIRAVTGKPFASLRPFEARELARVSEAHAGGRQGQELLDWYKSSASEFASVADPAYGFTTRRWGDWLDAKKITPKTAKAAEADRAYVAPDTSYRPPRMNPGEFAVAMPAEAHAFVAALGNGAAWPLPSPSGMPNAAPRMPHERLSEAPSQKTPDEVADAHEREKRKLADWVATEEKSKGASHG